MSYGTISQENENEISQAETLPLQSNRSHLPGEGHLNLQPQNITLSLLPVWNFFKSLNFISQFFFFLRVWMLSGIRFYKENLMNVEYWLETAFQSTEESGPAIAGL